MQVFRPYSLTAIGVCLFVVMMWFSGSNIDYNGGPEFRSLTTAGYFICGFPFIVCFGLVYAAPFGFLARRIHVVFGWIALVVASVWLIGLTAKASLPAARFANLFGEGSARLAVIHQFNEIDSFGDGRMRWGVVSGPESLLTTMAEYRDLGYSGPSLTNTFEKYFPDAALPDIVEMYKLDRMSCFQHPGTGRIYFVMRFADPNP